MQETLTTGAATPGTPRTPGTPGTAHRPARWVRTRLRADPAAALLMAALAFVTVLLSVAVPRLADRGADAALRDHVRQKGIHATSLQAVARSRPTDTAADLDAVQRELAARFGGKLPLSAPGHAHGTRTAADKVYNPDFARLNAEVPPRLSLMYLDGFADRVTLIEGSWPGPATAGAPLPMAVSRTAAEMIGIRVGDVVDSGSKGAVRRTSVVTGIYRVDDPLDPFWDDLGCPGRPCLEFGQYGDDWLSFTGLVDGASLAALTAWGENVQNFWRLAVDPAPLRADRLDRTRAGVAHLLAGPDNDALVAATGRADLRVSSFLPDVLTEAADRYRAATALSAIGPTGAAGVAVVVLCLAAVLATDRRAAELRLLRARGGSLGGVLLRLLGEGAVTVLPAAALGAALALVLLPTPRWGAAAAAGLATTLLALLAFPARAALLWARPRTAGRWRRPIGELTLLAATVAAVAEARRRGVGHSGAAVDPLLVAAPLLLAVTGGLLLARVESLLLGRLAALVGRGRGLIGFLGLARAAREASGRRRPSALPLLALLIATTATGFGATVLDSVDHGRLRAARIATGGDVAVSVPDYATLPDRFLEVAGALPGTRSATGIRVDRRALFVGAGSNNYTKVTLVVAEPAAYAEIARTLGVGGFDPARLAGTPGGPDTPVPALFSRNLADRLAAGAPTVHLSTANELRTTVAGIVTATPALPDPSLPFVVVPSGPAVERLPELGRATGWLAVGAVDPERVRALLREQGVVQPTGSAKRVAEAAAAAGKGSHGLPPAYEVGSSREYAGHLAADPLQQAAGRLFWYAAPASAGFAVLAVLLTLLRAAPDRTAVLARLRTMGLRPRQGLALILVEALPRTLVAAAGGGLVAVAAAVLLGSAFDLSTLVGAGAGHALDPAAPPVLLPTVGLALVACLGVVLETLVAGRRQIATELRAGES
ncbi:hypothetical protein ACGF13_23285 [Kitasatospora sp. NPDC048286]|uniref:hypothetical protein n=1 Tax=Kitasatospora sp. NPDC048286 TaxID=3364047 RepID=UPI003717FFE1